MYRIAAVMALLVTPVGASRVFTQASLGYAGINFFQTGTVNSTIPVTTYMLGPDFGSFTAGAAANAGFLGWGTSVLMDTNALGHALEDPGAGATADSFDILTPSGASPGTAGSLVFHFLVSGSNSALLTGNPAIGTSVGASDSRLLGCASNPQEQCHVFTLNALFNASSYTNIPVEATFPIIYGQPVGVHFELFSTTGATLDPNLVVNFSGSSDFAHTARLTSVELLDANGRLVSNPGLTADSGTIYPLNGVAPVPEPATVMPAALSCLIVVGYGYQHRNRRGERVGSTRTAYARLVNYP